MLSETKDTNGGYWKISRILIAFPIPEAKSENVSYTTKLYLSITIVYY